jgi:pyridoxal phosphate enzyme (YggS family)
LSDEAVQRITSNLARVEEHISEACRRAGRHRETVTLVAVSKTRTLEETRIACIAGIRHLGENRVEDLEAKVPALARIRADSSPTWHMIGHLQSRKASSAVELCQMLHSLDSLSLARKLDFHAASKNVVFPVLIECNTAGDVHKYGFKADDPQYWRELSETLSDMATCRHLTVRGLMTMAPIVTVPEDARSCFRKLRELRDYLKETVPFTDWAELSMGMTDDFKVAIEEGATMVRIGRAIFN